MAHPGTPGRPSKGPRRRFNLRVPEDIAAALEADAERNGQEYNEWLVEAIQRRLGIPTRQPRLPLAEAS